MAIPMAALVLAAPVAMAQATKERTVAAAAMTQVVLPAPKQRMNPDSTFTINRNTHA